MKIKAILVLDSRKEGIFDTYRVVEVKETRVTENWTLTTKKVLAGNEWTTDFENGTTFFSIWFCISRMRKQEVEIVGCFKPDVDSGIFKNLSQRFFVTNSQFEQYKKWSK